MIISFDIAIFFIYFIFIAVLLSGTRRLSIAQNGMSPSVSLIVAMRNEEKNVTECVLSLLRQNYPEKLLEIIIVDDNSEDETGKLLDELASRFPKLKIIHRSEMSKQGNKKEALQRAIAVSSGEILLLTDADCRPSQNWVRAIVSFFDSKTGAVIGFSPWIGKNDSLFHKIIFTDSLAAGFTAAGSAGIGSPVTCSGRNLAYRRQVFDEVGGFAAIQKSVSGDDDLFLHLVKEKTSWKIRFANSAESLVPSFHNFAWQDFARQKRRHLSAGKFYRQKSQLGYAIFHFSNLILWFTPLLFFFFGKNISVPFILLSAKIFIDGIALKIFSNSFRQKFSVTGFFSWEFIFIFYNTFLAPLSWFGKIRWK